MRQTADAYNIIMRCKKLISRQWNASAVKVNCSFSVSSEQRARVLSITDVQNVPIPGNLELRS